MDAVLTVALTAATAVVLVFRLAAGRRRRLLTGGGTDMSLRLRRTAPGRGWALGVARATGDRLLWYRVFALPLRPPRAVPRRGLEVVSHRTPQGSESRAVQPGAVVVECQTPTGPLHLAMSPETLAGLRSWLQAPA